MLSDASRRVLRLRVDGRSHLLGQPEWLADATDMDLVGQKNGSTQLLIESPPLRSSAPALFDQLPLWESNFNAEDTAFSLLESALRDALNGDADSDRIDRNVLIAVSGFSRVLELGFDSLSFNGGPQSPIQVTRSGLEVVDRLQREAPDTQRIVIAGQLNSLTHNRRSFTLLLRGNRTVRGFLPLGSPRDFAGLWGARVVIDGEAVFKPSGDLASIVASHIQPATDKDAVWESVPRARPQSIEDIKSRIPNLYGSNNMARVFGAWPGEESDEEFLAFLEAIE